MPIAEVNGITINYLLSGSETHNLLVLVNGLADDLKTWDAQVPALLNANYRILRYDNRGIGGSSRPSGPYTAYMLAEDLHALLLHLRVTRFHLLGVSMGGMIAQAYALNYPNNSAQGLEMLSLSLCCTYAQPTLFCSRLFDLWADMATRMSVQDVMRDVTLWAFTVPFFRQRNEELEEVERAMRELDMGVEAYLSQLNVIRKFDVAGRLEGLGKLGGLEGRKVMILAGRTDMLIPVVLSRELAERVEGSQFVTVKGGHACLVSGDHVHLFEEKLLMKAVVGVSGRFQQGCYCLSGRVSSMTITMSKSYLSSCPSKRQQSLTTKHGVLPQLTGFAGPPRCPSIPPTSISSFCFAFCASLAGACSAFFRSRSFSSPGSPPPIFDLPLTASATLPSPGAPICSASTVAVLPWSCSDISFGSSPGPAPRMPWPLDVGFASSLEYVCLEGILWSLNFRALASCRLEEDMINAAHTCAVP